MKARTMLTLVIAAAAVFWATPALAQDGWQLGGFNLRGDVAAGARFFIEEPSKTRRQKFEEYRDIPEGAFLDQLQLRLSSPDELYAIQVDGLKWGQDDQAYRLEAERLGLLRFGFEWDQTPHLLSTTARLLATEPNRGVFVLPTPRPNLNAYNAAPLLDEVGVRWDTARLGVVFTPTPDIEVRAEYTRIRKQGDRPMGMSFGGPGNNFFEVLEPIDQTIDDFRIRATLAREQWQLQLGYNASFFRNDDTQIIADNPCFGLTAAVTVGGCGADATGAPVQGRSSLAPDNSAHTVSLAGGINLPLRTRLTANASYGLRFQNQEFLPHTINPALASNPALVLPEKSLDGMVHTRLLNLTAVSRPLGPLTVTARYRLFDLDDDSRTITFAGVVTSDRTVATGDVRANRPSFTRQDADLEARWRFFNALAFTAGAGWERWDRGKTREVAQSDEYSVKAALDYTPAEWLQARLAYRPSFLRVGTYHTYASLINTELEPLTASSFTGFNSALLRKFDEAPRDRQRADLIVDVSPIDGLTATFSGGWRFDDYVDSTLGVQQQTTWSAGVDVSWMPIDRVTFTAGYVHELNETKQRARNREGGTPPVDVPDFDWITDNADTIDTFHLGATLALIPRVLDWNFAADYSTATGEANTRNVTQPISGTAAQQANATARVWPTTSDALLRLETALRYHFWNVWTASFGYVFESFEKHDFRTDTIMPFVPGVTSIWLGNDSRGYTAHVVGATLAYRFK